MILKIIVFFCIDNNMNDLSLTIKTNMNTEQNLYFSFRNYFILFFL